MYLKKAFILSAALILMLLFSFSVSALDVPDEDIIFFGDSTTAHLKVRGGVPPRRVWSGENNTVLFSSVNETKCVYLADEKKSFTLREAVKLKKPRVLVITRGVSGGAGILPPEEFKRIYTEMLLSVRESSPETLVIVQSVLPLSSESVNYYKKLTKQAVLDANSVISDICTGLSVPYIDTYPLLADNDGYLKKQFSNDSYMHLTKEAYDVILRNIYEYIKNIL